MRLSLEIGDHFAHWPNHPAQQQQIPLELVDLANEIGLGIAEDQAFQFFRPFAADFKDRKTTVHDSVQQRIRQKAGIALTQARTFRADPLANGIPLRAPVRLEGQNGFVPEENRRLFVLQAPFLKLHGMGHDKQAGHEFAAFAAIRFNLRPLSFLQHIFDRQRMQIVLGRQHLDGAGIR